MNSAREAGHENSPRKILVVDDGIDAAESMAMMLELWGYDVTMAHDGVRALELASSFSPDIVLLDVGLPLMDGYEVARRICAERDGGSPVLIAVTGYGQESDRKRSKEAGFDMHLTKPVDSTMLRELLAGLAKR